MTPMHRSTIPSHRRTTSRFALVALVAFLAAWPLTSVGRTQAPLAEGLGAVRVTSSPRPELQLESGEARTYDLTLENAGAAPVVVRVGQADFLVDETGGILYHPVASLPTSNASWIGVATEVVIPAASTIVVPVTIQVPSDVAPGTYWSLLLVQPADATRVDEGQEVDGVRTSVTVNVRFGIALITHVGGSEEPNLRFRDPDLDRDDVTRFSTVSVAIDNPGRYLAVADVWLELYDAQGNLVREVPGGSVRIYPGASLRHLFELGALEDGAYQAVVIADAGRDAVFGVRYDLDLVADE